MIVLTEMLPNSQHGYCLELAAWPVIGQCVKVHGASQSGRKAERWFGKESHFNNVNIHAT